MASNVLRMAMRVWGCRVMNFPILSHGLSLNTITDVLTGALQSINKLKKNVQCCQLKFLKCSQHKFYSSISYCFHYFVHILCVWICAPHWCLNGWTNSIHIWYSRGIHCRSVPSEFEHSSLKNNGPSDRPQGTKWRFRRRQLLRFWLNLINLWKQN
jgi:hypothetical protein